MTNDVNRKLIENVLNDLCHTAATPGSGRDTRDNMKAGFSALSCAFFKGNIAPETLIYMPAQTTNNLNFTIICTIAIVAFFFVDVNLVPSPLTSFP